MSSSNARFSFRFPLVSFAKILLALFAFAPLAQAQSAYVRVSQAGYETGETPFRAYLMSSAGETGATFKVLNSKGAAAYSGKVGALLGTWSHSKTETFDVYALDFSVPGGDVYTISVSGPVAASSPRFAVDCPETLYSGLLLNTLFFYETERDGSNFVRNALRTAPGHLKDENARLRSTTTTSSKTFRLRRLCCPQSSRISMHPAAGGTPATTRNTSKPSAIRPR
jgi:endoglucanase